MSIFIFDRFQMDRKKRLLMRDGEVIPLTPKAFDILQLLIENRGKIVEKETILRRVWTDTIVEEGNLTVNISTLRRHLGESQHDHRYIVTHTGKGYSFVAEVTEVNGSMPEGSIVEEATEQPACLAAITPVWGAMPVKSSIYVERPVDREFYEAITRRDSLVLVKGARQVGKTSLLARGLHLARKQGARVVVSDLQNLNASHLESIDNFFFMLAEEISDQLDLEKRPREVWSEFVGASSNFERYWRKEILGRIEGGVVWGLDEVDRLFSRPFGSEVFGLFRSWHNKRALEPDGPWGRLTLAISYATEAHLFITDLNQSPFNVGTRLYLDDFTIEQIETINRRYGSPIESPDDLKRLFRLVGGHPYLVNRALWEMSVNGTDLDGIYRTAAREDGIYRDHLHRLLIILSQDEGLRRSVLEVLDGGGCSSKEAFYRLRSAGIVQGETSREAVIRCELYKLYLTDRI